MTSTSTTTARTTTTADPDDPPTPGSPPTGSFGGSPPTGSFGGSPPTGSFGGSPPTGDTDKRDRLAERLRALRHRLDRPPADADAWELDLYSYDESLIVAADLLDLEVPKGARGEMSADQRQIIEDRLAAAGLDVRSAR